MSEVHPTARRGMSSERHASLVFLAVLILLLWMAPPLVNYLGNPDHGYQLSLARLIVLGGFPYVDLIFHYGPLVAWSSALVLWASGGLIGETLLCAMGYAASLTCLAFTGRARLGRLAGWLVPFVALLFLARFYKWYFWLFPAITLAMFHCYLEGWSRPKRGLFIAGATSALCALFRLDLGLVLLIFWGIVALTGRKGLIRPDFASRALGVFAGFAMPMALWLALLAFVGGAEAVENYATATLDGGTGVVSGWSHGAAPFDVSSPLSPGSGLWLGLWILPIGLSLGLVLGAWRSLRCSGREQRDARFLAGASILGIGLLPQAFYRAEGQHFLQALPPFFVVAPMLVRELLRELRGRGSRSLQVGRGVVAILGALTLIAGLGVRSFGAWDLAPLDSNGFARLSELTRGLELGSRHSIENVVAQITVLVPAEGRILVIPRLPQVYFFAERRLSGLLNMYAAQIFDNPKWRLRNFKHVRANPPAAVLVSASWRNPLSKDGRGLRSSHPELDAYLRKNYTAIALRGPWRILRPNAVMRVE